MKTIKPIPFRLQKSENHGILVQIDITQYFYNKLHYHPEFQITAIIKGDGIFYAGNNMSAFTENDVFIIGSSIPHLLKCSDIFHSDHSPGVKGVSLFFNTNSFGNEFFEKKEMQRLKALLQDAKRVIKVSGEIKKDLLNKIGSTPALQNEKLIITFLEILSLIAQSEKEYLNAEHYNLKLNNNEGERLNKVLDHTFQHYREEITIDQIAKVALLSRSQFSHFFKLHTSKTFIQFVNELRIEKACILLKGRNHTVEQICYEVGFKNVSNFLRHFKRTKGISPSIYQKSWTIIE